MNQEVCLKNITIVLHDTRVPENIGAAARASANMGVGQIVVSAPRNLDMACILKVATHTASGLVKNMRVCSTLFDALKNFNWVVGTTARLGGTRQVSASVADLAQKLIPISKDNQVAILFGPEDRGLTNEDLRLCHDLVTIPTAGFSSLNLGQAVMVICYELFKARNRAQDLHIPRLACRRELTNMYDELEAVLARIHCINPESPEHRIDKVRNFLNRYQLRSREVSILREICHQVVRYGETCYQEGLAAGRANPSQDQGPVLGK